MTGQRFELAEGELVGYDQGAGAPVVFLHGFSFDLSMWDPQVTALATRYRTVRYDLRGFGGSGRPAGDRGHVEDLLLVLDGLGLESAHLVGLSLGANVALAAAIGHPERVRSISLLSPGLPGHPWRTPRPPDEIAAVAARDGVAAARQAWLDHPIFASVADQPAAQDALFRMVTDYPAWQWQHGPRTPPLPDLAGALAAVSVPTLVVNGARDVEGYREIASLIAALVDGARRTELATAGHLLNLEQPDELNQLLLDFLASATTQAGGPKPSGPTDAGPPPWAQLMTNDRTPWPQRR